MPRNTAVLFLTHYFINDLRRVGGGPGRRMYGLYATFVKKHSNVHDVYWYSWQDRKLRCFDEQGNIESVGKKSMLGALLSVLRNIKSKRSLIVCLAYPYGTLGYGRRGFEYYIFLFFLTLLRICKIALLVTDYCDPPVELEITLKGKISSLRYIRSTIKDLLTLKASDLTIFVSRSYLEHTTKRYSTRKPRTCIIPNGSFPKLISPKYPKKAGTLTLIYGGSPSPLKDIPALIKCVERLRQRGYNISLVLTSYRGMPFEEKEYLRYCFEPDWLLWVKNVLVKADVGVVPYPRKIHWNLSHLIKVSDYMCAGKPVISTNLLETARILRTHNCGLIAHDWNEFENMVIKLYKDRKLAAQLGKNGRRAVEEHYDHEKNADQLAELMKTITRRGGTKA